jgi:hypothetical protein
MRKPSEEEEVELANSCGAEADAFFRSSLGQRTLTAVPHTDYRTLATAAAFKLARKRGASSPSTLDHAKAKAAVDRALVARGLGVVVPGAAPGRVTR